MFNLGTFMEDATHAMPHYGLSGAEYLKLDFAAFKKARDSYIERLHGIYNRNLKASGVELIKGQGAFIDDKVVEISHTDQKFAADHILIASGTRSDAGSFKGAEHCLTSDEIFQLEELPESMIVLGGGYIAFEMA